jgi:cell division protein ZapD
MSDVVTTVLFEHPLNEKMRTWLRIEFLLQQLHANPQLGTIAPALTFFRTASDLLDVLERGEVRTELLTELERQQQKLLQWADVPGVDMARIHALRVELKNTAAVLMSAPRIGQALREDRLINLVKQRLSIPGGCCSFDLPTLHIWLHLPQAQRDKDVQYWLETLEPLNRALTRVLDLIRQSGPFSNLTSLNGFFQDNAEGADLLRLRLSLEHQLYPQISGHKTRYAIRFLPLDSEKGQVPARLNFELACC